ncbi:hypothetical protein BJV78DRAFT_1184318 [Lactifluus subvellereus]|nr:hypothetical protein BJV78DRAFT_1184318 [Lactifluus subvellereus]
METQYSWPLYLPQHQFPPRAAMPDHWSSRSWQGGPYISPSVQPNVLPLIPATAPVATPVYQPALLYPDSSRTVSRGHPFNGPYVAMQSVPPATAPWPAVPAPYFTYPPGWTVPPMQLPHPQLHYLLDGEISWDHLHVNFASADLEFKRRNGSGIHHYTTLSAYDLDEPATNPPMTYVRVVCDAIPQWHVDVHVSGTTLSRHRRHHPALPYLTLEDVIWAVHASLHHRVSR